MDRLKSLLFGAVQAIEIHSLNHEAGDRVRDGVLASLGQLAMTRAYRKGSTLVVASMQYFGIVFASAYSLLLFGDHITPLGWAGIVVIVASGVISTALRARALPDTPAEEH
jgi:S-adenosylmethionine uptake transporter